MKIDRSNYEIWIIDWLDGNLNRDQVEQLRLFLDDNADLREEFSELNSLSVKPIEKSFPQKEQLKRSSSDLYNSQFEYLCIAYLENDLSIEQKTEIREIIANDPEKQKTFDQIQKLRLMPGNTRYNHRKKLIRLTSAQKIIRLSALGLGIAATITLIIAIDFLIPHRLQKNKNYISQVIKADSLLLKSSLPIVSDKYMLEQKTLVAKRIKDNSVNSVKNDVTTLSENEVIQTVHKDSSSANNENNEIIKANIPVYAELDLKEKYAANKLIGCNTILPAGSFDERTKLGRFLATTIREKILKEKTSKDTPLKAYEIAEAGVMGINKLLGWQMALDEKKDANGELSSVYFNSKLLKFNAPVKKSEPLP